MADIPKFAFLLPALFFVANAFAAQPGHEWREEKLQAPAFLGESLDVRALLPPDYDAAQRYPVLYLNDGQDGQAVGLKATLQRLRAEGRIAPLIVIAIGMPKDRLGAYGLSDRLAARSLVGGSRVGPIGVQAHAYSHWLADSLVPFVDARYRSVPRPQGRAILGWSLGGLNAFNLGWQYPEIFGITGAFSPSFWLAGERGDAAAIQRTRLAQRMLDAGSKREGSRFWLTVGDREETDDRDGDGIIDAVDDARDLVDGYAGSGATLRGLRQLGYKTNLGERDMPAADDTAAFRLFAGGEHNQASWAKELPEFLGWAFPANGDGKLLHFPQFSSARVASRNVDVWLPPGYDGDPRKRYPVLYLHDGQNLFDASRGTAYGGTTWGIDEAMTKLIASGGIRAAIVVAVWNTPARLAEYMPAKAVTTDAVHFVDGWPDLPRGDLRSDEYLAFLVDELKPFIDERFRTLPGRDDTMLMGSSMGGLISAYALTEYPQVFGRAACVSTHWPAGGGAAIDYFGKHLPDPAMHRFYFDHGTATLDAAYAPYQQRMDQAMRRAGYRNGVNWISREFPGADHSEKSWRKRVEVPLRFLLGR